MVVDYKSVKHMAIRVVQQSNNRSVVNTDLYYDGIIYKEKPDSNINGVYSIPIDYNEIKIDSDIGWKPKIFYKIQIRFGYNDLPKYNDSDSEKDKKVAFYAWKKAQTSVNGFSEWSNVIITKVINEPIVKILNNVDSAFYFSNSFLELSENIENTRFPLFQGGYYNEDSQEPLDKYRFRLYDGSLSKSEMDLIKPKLSTEWLQFNGSGNEKYSALVQYTFNQALSYINNPTYTVIFDTISKNGYHASSTPYTFSVNEGVMNRLNNITLVVKDNSHNGIYEDRFYQASKEVFDSYKKLFRTPPYKDETELAEIKKRHPYITYINKDAVYKRSDGSTIVYVIPDGNEDNINELQEYRLTLLQRQKSVKDFDENLRCDENAVLEIWIKNNTQWIETTKYAYQPNLKDGISSTNAIGFSRYEEVEVLQNLDGVYYLTRSDERSNFTIWEDLAKFDFYNETDYNDELMLLYEDFTIESGLRYKYALQKESSLGYRSIPKYEFNDMEASPTHYSNFQDIYIYQNGVQVRLNLDIKIQQFKHTRLFQKQDSLNSKYPIILRNGLANYGEFSLGGKITLHSDTYGSFLRRQESWSDKYGWWNSGYYYNNDLVIPAAKYMDLYQKHKYIVKPGKTVGYIGKDIDVDLSDDDIAIDGGNLNFPDVEIVDPYDTYEYKDHLQETLESLNYSKFNFNSTDDNIFMERIYRKYVEEFLNDGKHKLYKSPTEGNMIVTLTNVSLIPNQQLGRLIADFNSTVYEVADNTCANIKLYDINPLDVITNNMYLMTGERNSRYQTVFGQVRGAFDGQKTKSMTISSTTYKKLYDLELEPAKYFSRMSNGNFITYEKLPANIINTICNNEAISKEFSMKDNIYWDAEYDNIIHWIKMQEEKVLSDERKYELRGVSSIWVELYPKHEIEGQLMALKSITEGTAEELLSYKIQIAQYELLLKQYELSQSNPITLVINGKDIAMLPGRVYHVDNVNIQTIYLKYTRPVLINYIAQVEEVDNIEYLTKSRKSVVNLGQLAGVFTTTNNILNNHEPHYETFPLTVSNEFNYSLYKTLDVYSIIKQVTRDYLFKICSQNGAVSYDTLEEQMIQFIDKYNTSKKTHEELIQEGKALLDKFSPLSSLQKNSSTDIWRNPDGSLIVYRFEGLNNIKFEGDSNTEIVFGRSVDRIENGILTENQTTSSITIGPTNKYIIKTEDDDTVNELDYIKVCHFARPSYAIIDYKAIVSLEVKGK